MWFLILKRQTNNKWYNIRHMVIRKKLENREKNEKPISTNVSSTFQFPMISTYDPNEQSIELIKVRYNKLRTLLA